MVRYLACAALLLAAGCASTGKVQERKTEVAYTIKKACVTPALKGEWEGAPWCAAETADIDKWHSRSSDHHPLTQARLLHDDKYIYVHFRVEDKYLRCVAEKNQDSVCRDSCVEFFVRPKADKGYFNFEVNAGGVILLYYMPVPVDFKQKTEVSAEWLDKIKMFHTLPRRLPDEQVGDCTWQIEYRVPKALFEAYVGPLGKLSGQVWTMNLYKCADQTSKPHWGMWQDVGDQLSFHKPEKFAPVAFE